MVFGEMKLREGSRCVRGRKGLKHRYRSPMVKSLNSTQHLRRCDIFLIRTKHLDSGSGGLWNWWSSPHSWQKLIFVPTAKVHELPV